MTDKSSPVVGSPLLQIGDWQVDPDRNALIRSGEAVRLEPKAIEVLILLARSAGKVVGREELLATVWHGVIVGDDALTQAIIKLRKALGDSAQRPSYIETISKRGYRLIAPVAATGATTDAGGAGGPIAAPPARRRKIAVLAGAVALTLVASVVVFDSGGRLALPWPIGTASKGGTVAAAFPTVAVLPLVNLSGDPRRDYFSDGVTEDIISALGRFSGVRVMSRNAVQGFKGKSPSPQAIRDELGARYILRGSVREAGTTLRVAVELSDADHGTLLWSERYDGSDSEVFEIQERIARKIVGNLQVQLTQLEQQWIFTKPTDSLEAYDLVLRARSLLDPPERSTNRQARDLLARAEALAPAYAEVFTALGEAEMDRVRYGWIEDTADGLKRAETFGKRALASLDQRAHSRAHALLVAVYTYQLRYDEALSEADRAIALNASDSTALFERGAALLSVGRFDEAIAAMEEGKRFEPHAVRINLPFAYYLSERYREVIDEAGTMLVRAPSMVALHAIRGAAQAELGNANGARHEAEVVRRLSPYFQAENFANRFANPDHASRIHEGLRKAGL